MRKINKNHLYLCVASIALVGLSTSAWGMDYLSSWVEGEESMKTKVISALTSPVLPPIQNEDPSLTENRISDVTSVSLEKKYIGNFGVGFLCNYSNNLHTVNLNSNNIKDEGCAPLLLLPNLRTLDLSNNQISDEGVKVLLQHPSLATFKLSNNYVTFSKLLEECSNNSNLLSLDLSWNFIDHDGARNVAQISHLEEINLSNNKINDAGKILSTLAKSPYLRKLNFSNPYEIARACKALVGVGKAAGFLGRAGGVVSTAAVTTVVVGGAVGAVALGGGLMLGIGAGTNVAIGATTIKAAMATGQVMGATIAGGAIGVGTTVGIGAGITAGRTVDKQLSTTVDSVNSKIMQAAGKFVIGEEEAHALSQNTALRKLDLSDTFATSNTLCILISSPSITSLNLSWNYIDDSELTAITRLFLNNQTLTEMNLENNYIQNSETQTLINSILTRNQSLK